jgi:WD repeat-containing protein 26
MIPEHRLATLLTQVQQNQILGCRYHNTTTLPSLYTDHACSADDFPLHTLIDLRTHTDEVWYVDFSPSGSMLATAGKDGLVCVYDTIRYKLRHEFREHERSSNAAEGRGVVYVAFSPDEEYLISCSVSNEFVVMALRDGRKVAVADHFDYPVTCAGWLPDSQSFIVGSQGSRRPLGLYSIRNGNGNGGGVVKNNEIFSFREPPWDSTARDNGTSFRISDLAVSPDGELLAATTLENKVLLFDLLSRQRVAEWQMEDKLTSVRFDAKGQELLLSMNGGIVMLVDVQTGEFIRRFEGARQREFVVRSAFGGAGEGFVVSGSEGTYYCLMTFVTCLLMWKQIRESTYGDENPVSLSPPLKLTFLVPSMRLRGIHEILLSLPLPEMIGG